MRCWRASPKLRIAAQLLAAGILLAHPTQRARAQGPVGFSPGLVDTLIALAGAPRALVVATPFHSHWLGAYNSLRDSMVVHPILLWTPRHVPSLTITRQTRISPDFVLSHEFGHRYDVAGYQQPHPR